MMRIAIIPLIVLASAAPAGAQTATFLLPGVARAGFYTPLRVTAPAGPVTISGEGIVPIDMTSRGPIDQVVPVLVLHPSTSGLVLQSPTGTLSIPFAAATVDPATHIILTTGTESRQVAKSLFGDAPCAWFHVALTDVISCPAAFNSADALVITDTTPAPISPADILAAGLAIAVRADTPPDRDWPWQTVTGYQVLHLPLAGPRSAIYPRAYDVPWNAAPPRITRLKSLLLAALCSIGLLFISLLHTRRLPVLLICATLVLSLSVALWARRQSPIRAAQGSIILLGDSWTRHDQWTFLAAAHPAPQAGGLGTSLPILADAEQAQRLGLRLRVDGGSMSLHYEFSEPDRLALLDRTIEPTRRPLNMQPRLTSPLATIAQDSYLSPGWSILGQTGEPTRSQLPAIDSFPDVVLARHPR